MQILFDILIYPVLHIHSFFAKFGDELTSTHFIPVLSGTQFEPLYTSPTWQYPQMPLIFTVSTMHTHVLLIEIVFGSLQLFIISDD